MNVAFITHYESLYGANRSLLGMIDGLREYNVKPFVIGREAGAISEALKARGVPFVVVPFQWWVWGRPTGKGLMGRFRSYKYWKKEAYGRLRENLAVMPNMLRQLREWNIDIVYTNSSVTPIGIMAAHWLSCPHVWHLREFCDLHFGLEFDWGKRWFEYVVGTSACVVSVSNAVNDYYLQKVKPARKRVIYNGVASREFIDGLYEKAQEIPVGNPYRFLIIGPIQSNKGHDEALRAFAELASERSDIRLRIIGAGDTTNLKRMIHVLGLDGLVEYIRYVDEPFSALLDSDALLVCSRNEAMGRVTVEAMAACRPVIGYDQAGTSELVQHEKTGLLYSNGYLELADAMRRFLSDPQWAVNMGINGWRVARDNYTVEKYAENIYAVLESVMAETCRHKLSR